MDYRITFTEDLPEGHDFVLVQAPGQVIVVYRESAITPAMLEDSWAAYRKLLVEPEPRKHLTAV